MWVVAVDTPYYPEVRSYKNYEDAKKDYDWEIKHINIDDGYPDECVFIAEIKDWYKTPQYVVGEDEKQNKSKFLLQNA